jgi:hypothetical protein
MSDKGNIPLVSLFTKLASLRINFGITLLTTVLKDFDAARRVLMRRIA